ncbi:hypothetical protein [Halobacteriovorax sp. CON-3]|uniref:hypothetical protein n=1 Tax=Halobacteriovorax sp. CON-3 TaxID=3157710 RepID=UPI00370FFE41
MGQPSLLNSDTIKRIEDSIMSLANLTQTIGSDESELYLFSIFIEAGSGAVTMLHESSEVFSFNTFNETHFKIGSSVFDLIILDVNLVLDGEMFSDSESWLDSSCFYFRYTNNKNESLFFRFDLL